MALFDDIDAGDETRRDGDHVALPHGQGDGTELSSVNIPRGTPVSYDGSSLSAAAGDNSSEIAGVLQNYDVSGDTGKEVVGPDATVAMGGTVKADLTVYANGAGVTVGSYLGSNNELFVVEQIDADNNTYEVRVR